MKVDQFKNVKVDIKRNDEIHTQTLNTKVTKRFSLENIKSTLNECKASILGHMAYNILDQAGNQTLAALFSCFDVDRQDSLEERKNKIKLLYEIYGLNTTKSMPKWRDYDVQVTYRKRIKCSSNQLLAQFEKRYPVINQLCRERREVIEENGRNSYSQHKLWMSFISVSEISCPDLCKLIRIMISIPPNTGWIERAYSSFEMICSKRRNRLLTENVRELFFLAVLKLKTRNAMDYEDEIQYLSSKSS